MSILASIEHFVQQHFGDFFSSIEAFYLKNILILIQGILEPGHRSISSIARDSLNNVAHTTLTRFINGHPDIWKNLEKLIQKIALSNSAERERDKGCGTPWRLMVHQKPRDRVLQTLVRNHFHRESQGKSLIQDRGFYF